MCLIEGIEIIGLHDHVVELKEGQAPLPALLVALSREHTVDGEMCADLTKQFDVVQLPEPVAVVQQ